jgi:hypothetical protein
MACPRSLFAMRSSCCVRHSLPSAVHACAYETAILPPCGCLCPSAAARRLSTRGAEPPPPSGHARPGPRSCRSSCPTIARQRRRRALRAQRPCATGRRPTQPWRRHYEPGAERPPPGTRCPRAARDFFHGRRPPARGLGWTDITPGPPAEPPPSGRPTTRTTITPVARPQRVHAVFGAGNDEDSGQHRGARATPDRNSENSMS